MHQRRCTRGDAQELMHQSLCTRGDAPEERDAPAEMYQRRCIRKCWCSQNFLDSITGSNMPSALGLVVYFFPKWLRMFQNFSYKWHLRYQAFIWRRCYVSDFQHQSLLEATIPERQTETHISSDKNRFLWKFYLIVYTRSLLGWVRATCGFKIRQNKTWTVSLHSQTFVFS